MNNKDPKHWLTVTKKINSIAQTGLVTKDKFNKEWYAELLDLSITILNNITEIDTKKLDFVFNRDIGYQTPKVEI